MRVLRRALETAPLFVLAAACVWTLRAGEGATDRERGLAAAEAGRVVAAIERLWSDVGRDRLPREWPPDLDLLAGPGRRPRGLSSAPGDLADLLVRDGLGLPGWNGPYLERLEPDPWGRAYVATTAAFEGGGRRSLRLFVLSAGPNGRVETHAHDVAVHGDDIGRVARASAVPRRAAGKDEVP